MHRVYTDHKVLVTRVMCISISICLVCYTNYDEILRFDSPPPAAAGVTLAVGTTASAGAGAGAGDGASAGAGAPELGDASAGRTITGPT